MLDLTLTPRGGDIVALKRDLTTNYYGQPLRTPLKAGALFHAGQPFGGTFHSASDADFDATKNGGEGYFAPHPLITVTLPFESDGSQRPNGAGTLHEHLPADAFHVVDRPLYAGDLAKAAPEIVKALLLDANETLCRGVTFPQPMSEKQVAAVLLSIGVILGGVGTFVHPDDVVRECEVVIEPEIDQATPGSSARMYRAAVQCRYPITNRQPCPYANAESHQAHYAARAQTVEAPAS